jgi:hypothetical protein
MTEDRRQFEEECRGACRAIAQRAKADVSARNGILLANSYEKYFDRMNRMFRIFLSFQKKDKKPSFKKTTIRAAPIVIPRLDRGIHFFIS